MAISRIKLVNLRPEFALNFFDSIARYRVLELFAVLLQHGVRIDPAYTGWLFG